MLWRDDHFRRGSVRDSTIFDKVTRVRCLKLCMQTAVTSAMQAAYNRSN